ncbi:MAG: hypothetical protein M3P49_02315 [Actinomycetota bacterium]|nr:hypothetical protein [Actinomycetota bacterium]
MVDAALKALLLVEICVFLGVASVVGAVALLRSLGAPRRAPAVLASPGSPSTTGSALPSAPARLLSSSEPAGPDEGDAPGTDAALPAPESAPVSPPSGGESRLPARPAPSLDDLPPYRRARAHALQGDGEEFYAAARGLSYEQYHRLQAILYESTRRNREQSALSPSGRSYGSYDAAEWHEGAAKARTMRISHARGREKMRSALLPLPAHGYFVFEDLLTDEAGAVDFLAVGPGGIHYAALVPHEGSVWRHEQDDRLYWGQESVLLDAETDERDWYGGPFEEDLDAMIRALGEDVASKVYGGEGGSLFPYLCFTEARLHVSDGKHPRGVVSVWDLAYQISITDLAEYGRHNLPPEEVERFAAVIEETYGRPPWLVPEPHGGVEGPV